MQKETGNDGGSAWAGQRLSFREAYASYETPSSIKIWAGKRYYDRRDIHLMDFYYLNNSGTGFGVESIPVGNLGTVAVAIIKNQTLATVKGTTGENLKNADKDINDWKLDVRWNNIPLWTEGSLDLAFIYGWSNLSKVQKENENRQNNGFIGHIEYVQSNLLGGFNKLIFQYGHDGFDGIGTLNGGNHLGEVLSPYGWKDDFGPAYKGEKGNGYRLIDHGLIEQPKWNLGYVFMAAHRNAFDEIYTEGGANWAHPTGNDYAFVLRPSYKWNDFTSTVLEFGYTNQTNTGWNGWATGYKDRVKATKLTVAQQWAPTAAYGFWARPSIRVFASWLSGDLVNKEYTHLEDNHQITIGAQVEAWW